MDIDGAKMVNQFALDHGLDDASIVTDSRCCRGATRLTDAQADDFLNRFEIVDHRPNDAGESGARLL